MHYSVIVIGEDVEAQLEPFYQDLEVDEYEVGVVDDYDKDRMLEFYASRGEQYKTFEECYEARGEDWNYNRYRKDSNGVWMEYSTYNPNAEWDWYQIGGRWAGRIKVKEGIEPERPNFGWTWNENIKEQMINERRTDSALLKDIANVDELSCYSIVHEGEWICLGDDSKQELQDLLKTLSPDTRITFVDCHM